VRFGGLQNALIRITAVFPVVDLDRKGLFRKGLILHAGLAPPNPIDVSIPFKFPETGISKPWHPHKKRSRRSSSVIFKKDMFFSPSGQNFLFPQTV
jgi:hypothetical protein